MRKVFDWSYSAVLEVSTIVELFINVNLSWPLRGVKGTRFVFIGLFNEVDLVRVDSEIDKILTHTAHTEEALGPKRRKQMTPDKHLGRFKNS